MRGHAVAIVEGPSSAYTGKVGILVHTTQGYYANYLVEFLDGSRVWASKIEFLTETEIQ